MYCIYIKYILHVQNTLIQLYITYRNINSLIFPMVDLVCTSINFYALLSVPFICDISIGSSLPAINSLIEMGEGGNSQPDTGEIFCKGGGKGKTAFTSFRCTAMGSISLKHPIPLNVFSSFFEQSCHAKLRCCQLIMQIFH